MNHSQVPEQAFPHGGPDLTVWHPHMVIEPARYSRSSSDRVPSHVYWVACREKPDYNPDAELVIDRVRWQYDSRRFASEDECRARCTELTGGAS